MWTPPETVCEGTRYLSPAMCRMRVRLPLARAGKPANLAEIAYVGFHAARSPKPAARSPQPEARSPKPAPTLRCNLELQPAVGSATCLFGGGRSGRVRGVASGLHCRSSVMQAQLQRRVWSDERGVAYVETLILTVVGVAIGASLMAAGRFSLAPHFEHVVNAMVAGAP